MLYTLLRHLVRPRLGYYPLIGLAAIVLIPQLVSAQSLPEGQGQPPAANTPAGQAQTGGPGSAPNLAREVEALKRRVEELQSQNRALTEALTQVQAQVEALGSARTVLATAPAQQSQTTTNTQTPPAKQGQADQGQPVRWSEIISEGNKFKLYGFLRLDLIADSQRPNNSQAILFINSPDPLATNSENGDFTLHPRLTRLGMDFTGPSLRRLGDARLTGKLEVDFQNGGSESRQIVRVRHAYLNLGWKEFSVLAGQTWDLVSPLFPTVNNDTLQWNAGNVGDRRPQLRAAYEPRSGKARFSFTGGVGLTGAIDALDLDANGVRDGEESARPNVQGRAGFSYPVGNNERIASVGISAFRGFLRTARPVAGRTEFRSQLANLDFTLPVTGRLSLRGEGWWGRNMSDIRGGAGQGINGATGREVRGRGGWAEAAVRLSRIFSFYPGFSTDDPVDEDLPDGGRTRNRTLYLANRITPGGNFLVGADYLRWKTNYKRLRRGLDNRIDIFLQYNF